MDKNHFSLSLFLQSLLERYILGNGWCNRFNAIISYMNSGLRLSWIFGGCYWLVLNFFLVNVSWSFVHVSLSLWWLVVLLFIRVSQIICRNITKNFGGWRKGVNWILWLFGGLGSLVGLLSWDFVLHWFVWVVVCVFVVEIEIFQKTIVLVTWWSFAGYLDNTKIWDYFIFNYLKLNFF